LFRYITNLEYLTKCKYEHQTKDIKDISSVDRRCYILAVHFAYNKQK